MRDEALSPFCGLKELLSNTRALPVASRLTKTKCEVSRQLWVDLIPLPRTRENLLRAEGEDDDMELCGNLVGMFSDPSWTASMIVWAEPWNSSDWEVTETFIKRWGVNS